MSDSISTIDVFKSRVNLLTILSQSGYDVSEYDKFSLSHVSIMRDNGQLALLLTSPKNKVFVKYVLDKKLNVEEEIGSLFDETDPILNKSDNVIVVYKSEPNDALIALLDELWNDRGILVSVINIQRLQFNILKHSQVPLHTILSEDEKTELFTRLHISSNADLPTISRYDPVALVLCMRPGQVCKIDRKSKTAVSTLYYRAYI